MPAVVSIVMVCSALWSGQVHPAGEEPATSSERSRPVDAVPAQRTKATTAPPQRTWGLLDVYPGLRFSMGPLWELSRRPAVTRFSVDTTASAVVIFSLNRPGSRVRRRRFIDTLLVVPELGYSYDTRRLHLAHLGLGVGVQKTILGLVYIPRFVLGSSGLGLTYGLRHDLQLRFFLGCLTVELAHQVVWSGRTPQHDVRLVAGLDPVRFVFLLRKVLKR